MKRVFVLGNAAEDLTFAVDALPAKGESIFGREVSRDLGGKGANQAVVLARAGVETRLVAAVGSDPRGEWIRSEVRAEGLPDASLLEVEAPSDLSVILVMPDGDNSIVTTTAAAESLSEAEVQRALAAARPGDVLLLQGNLSVELTRAALRLGKRAGLFTAFNPSPVKPHFAALWPQVDLAVLNRGEATALSGVADPEDAAAAILAAGAGTVVVTLGAEGILLHDKAGPSVIAAPAVTALDTTGAGDTFTGALIASALVRGAPIDRRAAEAGVAAAALTISRRGTRAAFPSRAEMQAILAMP